MRLVMYDKLKILYATDAQIIPEGAKDAANPAGYD
jgi:hypothetical protein